MKYIQDYNIIQAIQNGNTQSCENAIGYTLDNLFINLNDIDLISAYTELYAICETFGKTQELQRVIMNCNRYANKDVWLKPTPLNNLVSTESMDFPLESFPIDLQEYIKSVADFIQVDTAMVGTLLLAILSSCVMGKVTVSHMNTNHVESVNLYTTIISKPAERKTAVLNQLMRPLVKYEVEENQRRKPLIDKYNIEKSVLESKISNAKKNSKDNVDTQIEKIGELQERLNNLEPMDLLTLHINDTTTEALADILELNSERCSIFSAEGGLFDTMGGRYSNGIPNLDLYLKSYDGEPVRIARANGKYTYLDNPLLSMGFLVQPDVIKDIFSKKAFTGRGLIQRFLFAIPDSKVGTRTAKGKDIPYNVYLKYEGLIRTLIDIKFPTPLVIKSTENANKLFESFFVSIEKALTEGGELSSNSNLIEWGGKLCGKCLRIACILHLCSNSPTAPIDETTMQNAIALCLYYITQAKILFSNGENQEVANARYILNKIRILNKLEVSSHELYQKCRKLSNEVFKQALNFLEGNHYIKLIAPIKKNPTGRNPTKIVKVNPIVMTKPTQK